MIRAALSFVILPNIASEFFVHGTGSSLSFYFPQVPP